MPISEYYGGKGVQVMLLSDVQAAYIAGFIDGEGCLGLSTRKVKYITPTIQVSNTNQEILQLLFRWFGGNIDIRRDTRPNRKQCNTWRTAGSAAREIIRQIRPFLIVKARQADIILSLPVRTAFTRMKPEDFEANSRAILEIRKANRRGVDIAA